MSNAENPICAASQSACNSFLQICKFTCNSAGVNTFSVSVRPEVDESKSQSALLTKFEKAPTFIAALYLMFGSMLIAASSKVFAVNKDAAIYLPANSPA